MTRDEDRDQREGRGRRESDWHPPETGVKVTHMWLSVMAVIITISSFGGGIIWSLATFKSETLSSFSKIGAKVEELGSQIGQVSQTAQESRDWIMKKKGAEEEAARQAIEVRPNRRTPVFGPAKSID